VEDFVDQASAQILTLVEGNGCGAAVGVAEKYMAAVLSALLESYLS